MHVSSVTSGDFTYSGTTPGAALALLESLADELAAGEISTEEAKSRLREFGSGLGQIADWIEAHKFVTTGLVGLLAMILPPLRDLASDRGNDLFAMIATILSHLDEIQPDA